MERSSGPSVYARSANLFGYSHGLMVVNAFFENVSRARMEGRELQDGEKDENVVLEFRPNTSGEMLIACLWSHCFGFAWIGAYFIVPLLRGWWPSIAQPSIPPEAWIAIGGVLGVASFFRGKMQSDPRVLSDNRG
ncbi:hypothetical protein [Paraburkholderia sp. DGU8]|uniref:hypothetical protein n=1 Tax=Paraburkholderia sp. DGU8 TaxID=3161997 RepID=UPI0034664285